MADALLKTLIVLVSICIAANVFFLMQGNSLPHSSPLIGEAEHSTVSTESKSVQSSSPPYSSAEDYTATSRSHSSSSSSSSGSEVQQSSGQNSDNAPGIDIANSLCLMRFKISQDTVIFYYEEGEAHSMNMKPVVDSLQQRYNFYYMDQLWNASFNECFGFSGNVPAFLCAGTGQMMIGEVSSSNLEAFARGC